MKIFAYNLGYERVRLPLSVAPKLYIMWHVKTVIRYHSYVQEHDMHFTWFSRRDGVFSHELTVSCPEPRSVEGRIW